VSINEESLERKVAAPVKKTEINLKLIDVKFQEHIGLVVRFRKLRLTTVGDPPR
jgi:hypothetical protein